MALAEAGGLAIRRENNCMVAYYAQSDTMQDAIKIGAIYDACVVDNPECWEAFMSLMVECVKGLIGKVMGEEHPVVMGKPRPLKEH